MNHGANLISLGDSLPPSNQHLPSGSRVLSLVFLDVQLWEPGKEHSCDCRRDTNKTVDMQEQPFYTSFPFKRNTRIHEPNQQN